MRKQVYLFIAFVLLASGVLAQKPAGTESGIIAKTAGDAPASAYDGGRVRFLANREETGKQFSIVELTEPAGYKTPLHRHTDADEAFYVVEGELTAQIGDGEVQVFGPGSFVLIPRGTVHAQGNFGTEPVKVLVMTTPGGLDKFFADRVELFKSVKPGDPRSRNA
jgi:quercetin dioxygenase-like cupin family protein